jgi:solute carrier family 35 protein
MLLYNSLLSSPILLLFTAATGELGHAAMVLPARMATEPRFAAVFCATLLLGCLLNFAIFLCTRVNSALTTTIVGVLKGVALSILGFVLLGGVEKTTTAHLAGIALNTIGGVWYAQLEYSAKQAKRLAFAMSASGGAVSAPLAGAATGGVSDAAPADASAAGFGSAVGDEEGGAGGTPVDLLLGTGTYRTNSGRLVTSYAGAHPRHSPSSGRD